MELSELRECLASRSPPMDFLRLILSETLEIPRYNASRRTNFANVQSTWNRYLTNLVTTLLYDTKVSSGPIPVGRGALRKIPPAKPTLHIFDGIRAEVQ